MNVEIDNQAKKFWKATTQQWVPFYGHEIKVGKYRFAVGGTTQGISILEVTTGFLVKELPFNMLTEIMCETKEGTLDYYAMFLAPMLIDAVNKNDMETVLKDATSKVHGLLGVMPEIELFDDSIIRDSMSDIVN